MKYDTENTTLHTWFERDRSCVEIRDHQERTVAEWWDEDVVQLVEDGFLDPKDYHSSACAYVNYLTPNSE